MKKILVVVDMQNDFIDGALGSKEAVAIVPNVVKKIKDNEWDQIVVTQDTHYDNYMETQEGKKLPVPHCMVRTNGWGLNPHIKKALSDKTTGKYNPYYIEKITFGSIELPALWNGHSQKDGGTDLEFTFVGLCTDICVISNAMLMKAYYPEARIIVDASCCAGVTPKSHKNALEAMKMCQIEVINE